MTLSLARMRKLGFCLLLVCAVGVFNLPAETRLMDYTSLFSLRLVPSFSLPLGEEREIFSFGGGGEVAGTHTLYVQSSSADDVWSAAASFAIEIIEEGGLDLTITVASPSDETITLDKSDDVNVSRGGSLSVTVTETFDSYEWILDGDLLSGEQSGSVTVDCSAEDPGYHYLTAIVETGGWFYSETLRFVVSD